MRMVQGRYTSSVLESTTKMKNSAAPKAFKKFIDITQILCFFNSYPHTKFYIDQIGLAFNI